MTVRPLDPAVIGEQCEHTEWVPEIESWVRCTANTLMHTPDTRVLCPEHCSCNEGASVDYPPLPDFLHAESEPVRYSKDEDGPQGEPNMSPSKFRKKPVEIEAMRFDRGTATAVHWWIEHNTQGVFDPTADELPGSGVAIDPATGFLLIATLEGVMQAKLGDWIIRGVAGEFYPCKPDIFEATYEAVEPCEAVEP